MSHHSPSTPASFWVYLFLFGLLFIIGKPQIFSWISRTKMFDFGDEFILDNNRIPWLIWIQILVMFLLTFIIIFTYFVLDSSTNNSLSTVSPTLENPSSCSGRTQVGRNHGKEMATTSSCRTRRVENNSERDGNSSKDLTPSPVTRRFFHPCTYFDFAKQAFLKCLGLGSGSNEHEHED